MSQFSIQTSCKLAVRGNLLSIFTFQVHTQLAENYLCSFQSFARKNANNFNSSWTTYYISKYEFGIPLKFSMRYSLVILFENYFKEDEVRPNLLLVRYN